MTSASHCNARWCNTLILLAVRPSMFSWRMLGLWNLLTVRRRCASPRPEKDVCRCPAWTSLGFSPLRQIRFLSARLNSVDRVTLRATGKHLPSGAKCLTLKSAWHYMICVWVALCRTNRAIFCDLKKIAKIVTKLWLYLNKLQKTKNAVAVCAKKQ